MALRAERQLRRHGVGFVCSLAAAAALSAGCPVDGLTDGGRDTGSAGAPDGTVDAAGSQGDSSQDASLHDRLAPDAAGAADATDAGDAPACPPFDAGTVDDCTQLLHLASAPVIDGVLECGIPLWTVPQTWWTGSAPAPTGVQVQLGAAWSTSGLYLFVQVTRPSTQHYPAAATAANPWCGDAVEFFVDSAGTYADGGGYNEPGTAQFICPEALSGPATSGWKFVQGAPQGPWAPQNRLVVVETEHGFNAEAFIIATDIGLSSWHIIQGGSVGLDLAIDLGQDPAATDSGCPTLGQFYMHNLVNTEPAKTPRAFCDPTLR